MTREEEEFVQQNFPKVQEHSPGLAYPPSGRTEVVRAGDALVGFLSLDIRDFSDGCFLAITSMYLEPGHSSAIKPLFHMLKDRALAWGCCGIVFDTTRPGWKRRLQEFGFEPLPYFRMKWRDDHG